MSRETDDVLTPDEQDRLAAFRAARSLTDLIELTGADSAHEAYFAAKREWTDLRGRQLAAVPTYEGLPGARVNIDETKFHVHGITHADTTAEGEFLREQVTGFLDSGATVFCEQGIRPMYFSDVPAVCAMDDYRWAMARCRSLGIDSHIDDPESVTFDEPLENLRSATAGFRDAVYELVNEYGGRYGNGFQSSLGDIASSFLTSHADLATGEEFESFRLARIASNDPTRLADLQRYYERTFLPQPLEREWLARHDRELELVTHARNERMADYAVYHVGASGEVHLIVGAAHQPGVTYYLEQHRDGLRELDGFELY